MKLHVVLALLGAAATPIALSEVMGPIDSQATSGEGDLMARAEEIAKKEFSVVANLSVEQIWVQPTRMGAFGETLRADPGYAFHFANVRIENVGKLDFAVSTWHFSGIDEIGSDHGAELGNAHEDFDASRLGKGHARNGVVIFELPRGSYLTAVAWQGELGGTSAPAPAYAYS